MRQRVLDVPWIAAIVRSSQERATPRGFYVLAAMLVFAALSVNLRSNQSYLLFATTAGALVSSVLFSLARRPRVTVECRLPSRATAGTPLAIHAFVRSLQDSPDLRVSFQSPMFTPTRLFCSASPKEPGEVRAEFRAERRGKYDLPGMTIRSSDPLRLVTSRAIFTPPQTMLVYPRYYQMEEFIVPLGRRYQPGGIPLSSNTGDSIEFIGTRGYREGDPIKSIHWRSWARLGKPVVKEFQEEYFCRIAIILDTFLPAGVKASPSFEAAISVVASITDYFSRGEYVVDILAAGPDIYEVSAGRSLAYLENILDVMACLEPCYDPPFSGIGPVLFDKLEQTTTVVAILQDWDPQRRDFLRRVSALGAAVRAIVVRDDATTLPLEDDTERMSPQDVEELLRR